MQMENYENLKGLEELLLEDKRIDEEEFNSCGFEEMKNSRFIPENESQAIDKTHGKKDKNGQLRMFEFHQR